MWGTNTYCQPMQPRAFKGQWVSAKTYQDALNMPIPMDGTPILVMLEGESTFYIISMQNGQRMISGFNFNALTPPEQPTANVTINDIDARLQRLEALIGGAANESDIKPIKGNAK